MGELELHRVCVTNSHPQAHHSVMERLKAEHQPKKKKKHPLSLSFSVSVYLALPLPPIPLSRPYTIVPSLSHVK